MLFELNPPSIEISSTIKKGGKEFPVSHILRRPGEPDWIAYDKGLAVAIEDGDEKGSIRYSDDEFGAACSFWDAICLDVTGYADVNPPNFRDLVPPNHKRASVNELTRVYGSAAPASAGLFLACDEETVRISAHRGEAYPELIHRFKAPSARQRIEYSRITADSYTMKNEKTKTDRVILPSRLSAFVLLYNALIVSVEGYSLNGEPLTDSRIKDGEKEMPPAKVIAFMDAQHKRTAVQLLFSTEDVIVMGKPADETDSNK